MTARRVGGSLDPSPLVVLRRSIVTCELYGKDRHGYDIAIATTKNGASATLQILGVIRGVAA